MFGAVIFCLPFAELDVSPAGKPVGAVRSLKGVVEYSYEIVVGQQSVPPSLVIC